MYRRICREHTMKKTITLLTASILLAGCGGNSQPTEQTAAPVPSTPVTVVHAEEMAHSPIQYHIGRMEAVESAQLTPRTSGFLLNKLFDDGAFVEAGAVLFEIDPTSYQAAFDAAKATLSEAQSALSLTQLNHERTTQMLKSGGISQSQLDLSIAELEMARSRVVSARANVRVQQDNLDQTQVKAPYSGQLGKSNFSIGDMVGPNFGPLIDLIKMDPIDATFSIKESELSQYQLQGKQATSVLLERDGQLTDYQGNIAFVDNKVNAASGTVTISASFDNSEAGLLPNQFVRVGLTSAEPLSGVQIPHKAIHQDQLAQYVLTIEEGNAVRRDVVVGDRIGQDVFVANGLDAGEPVIVGGLQRIRPGAPVSVAE